MVYYPALITSAIFFAAIIVNLKNQDFSTAFGIGILAIPSILFLTYLSKKNMNIVAYFLLIIPIIIVIAGYEMGIKRDESTPFNNSTTNPVNNSTPNPENIVPPRIEAKEETQTNCPKCAATPCMCPYQPTHK